MIKDLYYKSTVLMYKIKEEYINESFYDWRHRSPRL